jgi:hypothetical protein
MAELEQMKRDKLRTEEEKNKIMEEIHKYSPSPLPPFSSLPPPSLTSHVGRNKLSKSSMKSSSDWKKRKLYLQKLYCIYYLFLFIINLINLRYWSKN